MEAEKHFDEWAKNYNIGLRKLPFFEKWLFDKVLNKIKSEKCTILDLGTGDGRFLLHIARKYPKCKFIGIDISNEMLSEARKNFNKLKLKSEFIHASLEKKIKLKSNSVNYVVSSAAIHHVKNKANLYSEIYRILKQGGKLMVVDCFEKRDKKYKELQKIQKKKAPSFYKKYMKNFLVAEKATEKSMKELKIKHPKEYHLAPFTLKKLLEKVGFVEFEIIPSPKYFAVYIAEKK